MGDSKAPSAPVRASASPVWWRTPVMVLARETWRVSWREMMTRVELVLLLILAVVSDIAAVGSPTAGDGAIQTLAVCLSVVPFALVLSAGQVWRQAEDEAAVFGRPMDAATYVTGRAVGLILVGAAMLGLIDLVASVGLSVVAHLPFLPSLSWDTGFAVVVVGPEIILVAGLALFWIAVTGGGSRYYVVAIVLSLATAFWQYKLPTLTPATGGFSYLASPFPGLLQLGLALPPALTPPAIGWLWLNRAAWIAVAGVVLVATMWIRAGRRETPARSVRALALTGITGVVLVLGLGGSLWANAAVWSPPLLPSRLIASASGQVAPGAVETLNLTVSPSASAMGGSARVTTEPGDPGRLAFWLNSALTVSGITVNRIPVGFQRVDGGAVLAGTAAGLWSTLAPVPPHATVVITYSGPVGPEPLWLTVWPYVLGRSYEAAYFDPTRFFLEAGGSWYPRFPAPGLGGRPVYTADRLGLILEGAMPSPVATTLVSQGGFQAEVHYPGPGPLPDVLWMAGPYVETAVDGVPYYSAAAPGRVLKGNLVLYAAALRAVDRWLPARSQGPLKMVRSPLNTSAALAGGILVLPENQPFCVPPDPASSQCGGAAPTLLSAMVRVALVGWADGLGMPGGQMPSLSPVYGKGDQRGALVAPLAAVTAWRAAPAADKAAIRASWAGNAALPGVGALSAAEKQEALTLAAWAKTVPASAFSAWATRVERLANGPVVTWSEIVPGVTGARS